MTDADISLSEDSPLIPVFTLERSDREWVYPGIIGPSRSKGYHLQAMPRGCEQRGNKGAACTSTLFPPASLNLTVSYRMIISNMWMISELATSITDASALETWKQRILGNVRGHHGSDCDFNGDLCSTLTRAQVSERLKLRKFSTQGSGCPDNRAAPGVDAQHCLTRRPIWVAAFVIWNP